MARCYLALLLLVNYLLVVGMGCISRPEEQHELLLVQTTEAGQRYQECRYLRMDGLENFLLESLASRYQKASETPKHHLISVVSGIDAHCLNNAQWLSGSRVFSDRHTPDGRRQYRIPSGFDQTIYIPPRGV